MKRKLIKAARCLLYYQWPFREITTRLRPRAGVLLYHRVGESLIDHYGLYVSPANFEEHLKVLQRNYHVMAMPEFLDRFPHRRYPDQTVIVTFDDGYLDNFTTAYPIAARLDIPVTVFVVAGAIHNPSLFWWDELEQLLLKPDQPPSSLELEVEGKQHSLAPATTEKQRRENYSQTYELLKHLPGAAERRQHMEALRTWALTAPAGENFEQCRPMTLTELKEFASLPGVNIGAHTNTHTTLKILSVEEQVEEFAEGKRILEDWLGQPIRAMAYPFGDGNKSSYQAAAQAGYEAAFTTVPIPVIPSASPFSLPRLNIHDWSGRAFEKRLHDFFGK